MQICPVEGDMCEIMLEDIDQVENDSMTSSAIALAKRMEFAAEELSMRKIRPSTVRNFQDSKGTLRKVISEIFEDAEKEAEERTHPTTRSNWLCRRAQDLVEWNWFEVAIGLIIFINMLTIGIEAQLSLTGGVPTWVTDAERVFLFIYTLELLLRLMAEGWCIFCSVWFLLDFFLVGVGLVATVATFEGIEKILVVRGLRLLRLVRALRMFKHCKVVWHLVYALLSAGQTVMSATGLIAFTLYIFACVAVEIITKDTDLQADPVTSEIIARYFSDLPTSGLTLMQFVTLDSIAVVYSPLIKKKPFLGVYFAGILIFVSIGLMNLITAVIIEGAMDISAEKRDEERTEMKSLIKNSLPGLLDTFAALDVDHSGCISRAELQTVHGAVELIPHAVLKKLPIDDAVDLFELLDVDESNLLTQTEFVEGLLNIALLDTPIWTLQTLKLLRKISHATENQARPQSDLNGSSDPCVSTKSRL